MEAVKGEKFTRLNPEKKKKAISVTDSSSRAPGMTITVSRSVQMKWNSPVITQKQPGELPIQTAGSIGKTYLSFHCQLKELETRMEVMSGSLFSLVFPCFYTNLILFPFSNCKRKDSYTC